MFLKANCIGFFGFGGFFARWLFDRWLKIRWLLYEGFSWGAFDRIPTGGIVNYL